MHTHITYTLIHHAHTVAIAHMSKRGGFPLGSMARDEDGELEHEST